MGHQAAYRLTAKASAPMFVIELFLPLVTGNGEPVPFSHIEDIVAGMADRFGGATAFTRSPADGLWKGEDAVERDRIIVVEVMVEEVDYPWWRNYRSKLEAEFQQKQVLVRVSECELI
jgi:hypothetical protein